MVSTTVFSRLEIKINALMMMSQKKFLTLLPLLALVKSTNSPQTLETSWALLEASKSATSPLSLISKTSAKPMPTTVHQPLWPQMLKRTCSPLLEKSLTYPKCWAKTTHKLEMTSLTLPIKHQMISVTSLESS